MQLDVHGRATVKQYVDMVRDKLASLGLSFEVDSDMSAFKEFYNKQSDRLNFPTSLDSDFSILPPDSFWLKVNDSNGDTVACHGQKLFETKDFVQSLRLHLCYADKPADLSTWFETATRPEVNKIRISGRVVLGGGLWIRKDWRGKNLMIFNRANRAMSLWYLDPDYFVGWLDYRDSRLNMAKAASGAGYAHAVRLSDDLYPPTVYIGKPAKPRPMLLAYASAEEWYNRITDELNSELVADDGMRMQQRPHGARQKLGPSA